MDQNVITKQGALALQQELEILVNVKRAECAERIKVARDFGDLSENAEYDAAKDEQAKVEGRILEIEAILKNSKIVDVTESSGDVLIEGLSVVLYDETNKETLCFELAGRDAKYPESISSSSPLGAAIKGKKKNDRVSVKTPGGVNIYVIKEIKKPGDK